MDALESRTERAVDQAIRGGRLGDRGLFPTLSARAYLNHAAISPPSAPVRSAMGNQVDDVASRGVAAFPTWRDQRERLRARLARLIGAQPDDLGFVGNTSQGVSAIALCIPWAKGDRILLMDGEFPANVTPWQQAARLFGLETLMLPMGGFASRSGDGLQQLEEALANGARLLAVSAVQFQTGLAMPLREMSRLAHQHGAELFVDGIQACGITPLDVSALGIDYLACGGHKWLMGPEGTGFLYVDPRRVAALRPAVASWLSHEDALAFLFQGAGHLRYDREIRSRTDLVESGMQNAAGLAGLEPAVAAIEALGPEAILDHVTPYLDALERGLADAGFQSVRATEPQGRSGILSLRIPADLDLQELHDHLNQGGVACSMPDGFLRFAPHWPNALSEVDEILDAALDAVARMRA